MGTRDFLSIYNLGLLGSVVADRFGVRLTAIIGGIFLFLGVFLTAIATSLLQVFLCYGVLAGMHVGFLLFFFLNISKNIQTTYLHVQAH